MKTQIFLLTLFSLALVGAITYSGESVSFLIPEQYDYYSIVGNSTPINLNITQDGLNITITVDKYQQTDNFEIIFFNKEKEIITQTIYTGGGGGGSSLIKYVDRNITKNIPIYTDVEVIKEVPVDVEKIVYQDTGFKLWIIILLMVLAGLVVWLIMRRGSNKEYKHL